MSHRKTVVACAVLAVVVLAFASAPPAAAAYQYCSLLCNYAGPTEPCTCTIRPPNHTTCGAYLQNGCGPGLQGDSTDVAESWLPLDPANAMSPVDQQVPTLEPETSPKAPAPAAD